MGRNGRRGGILSVNMTENRSSRPCLTALDYAHPQALPRNSLDVPKNMAEKTTEPVYVAIAAGNTFSSSGPNRHFINTLSVYL